MSARERENNPQVTAVKNDTILYKQPKLKECVKMIDDDRDQINRTFIICFRNSTKTAVDAVDQSKI